MSNYKSSMEMAQWGRPIPAHLQGPKYTENDICALKFYGLYESRGSPWKGKTMTEADEEIKARISRGEKPWDDPPVPAEINAPNEIPGPPGMTDSVLPDKEGIYRNMQSQTVATELEACATSTSHILDAELYVNVVELSMRDGRMRGRINAPLAGWITMAYDGKRYTQQASLETIEMQIDKTSGARLGLTTDCEDGRLVLVKDVKKDGLVAKWNHAHPWRDMIAGDRIFQVNDVSFSARDLVEQLKENKCHTIKYYRITNPMKASDACTWSVVVAWEPDASSRAEFRQNWQDMGWHVQSILTQVLGHVSATGWDSFADMETNLHSIVNSDDDVCTAELARRLSEDDALKLVAEIGGLLQLKAINCHIPDPQAALRAELNELGMPELVKRAHTADLSNDRIEESYYACRPREFLINLILRRRREEDGQAGGA